MNGTETDLLRQILLKVQALSLANADTTATGTITTENLVPAGAATAGSAVSIDFDSKGTVTIQVTGTYTGALSAQITTDGTNWITPANTVFKNMTTGANSVTIPSASVGIWQIEVIGHAKFRLSALAAVTGTATVALRAAASTSQVSVAGVSTSANQTTGNSSLTSIDSKTPALGQALAASSVPVVLPAAQLSTLTPLSSVGITGSVAVTGTFWQATQPVSLGTLPSITANTAIEYGAGATTAKTQRVAIATDANSVVFASPQAVTIATLPALATGANAIGSITNASFAATQSGTWNVTNISGTVSLPTGASTSALQIAGNTSLSNLDTRTAKATTAPTTSVASSATSTTLLALNTNRKYASFRNDSTSVAYVAKSATATTSSVYLLQPQGNLYFDDYTGVVTAIWVTANGFMQIEEGT
jgi:hypothetical protein